MQTIADIPEAEREYIIPGRRDVFKHGDKYWMYLGKYAGWREHDRIHITQEGNIAGVIGEIDEEAARAAAERIVANAMRVCRA